MSFVAADGVAANDNEEKPALEEIVVTAQFREQSALGDTTYSGWTCRERDLHPLASSGDRSRRLGCRSEQVTGNTSSGVRKISDGTRKAAADRDLSGVNPAGC